jgi:hypothetical protein
MEFKEWLELKEGGWMPDERAEETSGGVRAKMKSKQPAPAAGAAMGGTGGAPMGGGLGGAGALSLGAGQ